MTSEHTWHPDLAVLETFAVGKLDDEAHDRVEKHVAHCELCCHRLRRLPSADRLLSLLREAQDLASSQLTAEVDAAEVGGAPGLAIGSRLRYFGDYELLREVARGGMGIVYKARQTRLKRIVALKVILASRFASNADVQRFHLEAESAAQLQHPGIVPIYEVGEYQGHHYYSMGLVEGESLAARLSDGALSPRQAGALIEKVAEALSYAHDRGVIHRDLKPANILIDADGRPQIADFGLAKRVEGDSELTASGQVIGTPAYMPPEQAAGRSDQIGPESDVYSLGATLYAALTGRPPFVADRPAETLMQVLEREPISPRTLNPSISSDLDTICLKCLEKDRRRRYPTAGELAAELRRYLDGRPITARPISRFARFGRWCKRRPAVAALAAAVCVSLLGGSIASTWFAIAAQSRAAGEAEQRGIAERREREATAAQWLAQQALETAEAERRKTEAALKTSQRNFYFNLVTTAQLEWQANNPERARELLKNAAEELQDWDQLRHWEWHYLKRLCHPEISVLRGHRGPVMAVAFSPDGKLLASGSGDQTVRFWNRSTGQTINVLAAHDGPVYNIAFSPDSALLASCSGDGAVKLWDVANGELKKELGRHRMIAEFVAFSPDGSRLASAGRDQRIQIWDTRSYELVESFDQGFAHVYRLAFSPDGRRLATVRGGSPTAGGKVIVYDLHTGEVALTLDGHQSLTTSVSYSSDGRLIAGGCYDGSIRVWDAATGEQLLLFDGHDQFISTLNFSPDSRRIASVSSDLRGIGGRGASEIKIWDSSTGTEELTLRGHTQRVRHLAFSPDGRQLATAGFDATVAVWDTTRRKEARSLDHGRQTVSDLAVSPDSRRVAVSGNRIRVWDLVTEKPLLEYRGHAAAVNHIAFHPDGIYVASGGPRGPVKIWNSMTGEDLTSFDGHSDGIVALCFHPDGRQVLSASADGTVKLWDMNDGVEKLSITVRHGAVTSGCIDPQGKWIAVGTREGTIAIHEAAGGSERLVFNGHNGRVTRLVFSLGGEWLASASVDKTAMIWNAESGEVVHTLRGHTRNVNDVAFSPDGRRLVTGSRDETVRIWDVSSGHPVLTLRGHPEGVLAVDFTPDGRDILSGGYGGALKVWAGDAD